MINIQIEITRCKVYNLNKEQSNRSRKFSHTYFMFLLNDLRIPRLTLQCIYILFFQSKIIIFIEIRTEN